MSRLSSLGDLNIEYGIRRLGAPPGQTRKGGGGGMDRVTVLGPRLTRRLGKDNRRTDVQRIRGESTDEWISTDLDCIKNRLWGVQTVNHF